MQLTRRHASGSRRLTPAARFAFLAIVALVCIGGGGLRHLQNQQRREAFRAAQRRAAQQKQLAQQTVSSVRQLWQERAAATDLEATLNDGRPFQTTRQGEHEIATWTDAPAGVTMEFTFHQDRWIGFGTKTWTVPATTPAIPPSDQLTEAIRRSIAGWWSGLGIWTWTALVLAAVVFRQRLWLVLLELSLAVAVVTTTAWLVAPNYALSWQGIFSNDMLAVGAVMLLLNAGLIMLPVSRRQSDPRLCTRCGYDLTGNLSGTCPECGTLVTEAQTRWLAAAEPRQRTRP
jgi:hypothetical protein